MTEDEWTQVRTYLEHSGLVPEDVMKACAEYQAHKQMLVRAESEVLAGQMPLPLVGVEHFNGA